MKAALAVVALLIGVAAAGLVRRSSPIDKIVGGYIVEKGAHKYQVHLELKISFFGLFTQTSWGCGGSIIDSEWILTAAHCVHGMDGKQMAASAIRVQTGKHDGGILESHAVIYNVAQVIVHESYNKGAQFTHDVALLKLATPIQFNDHTAIIPLAAADSSVAAGTELYVSGWGAMSAGGAVSEILRAVMVNAVDSATCNAQYGGKITDNMMCASAHGKDSCQGDSGGPLVRLDADARQVQVGVVSWGYGCADPQYAGVYASVAVHLPWISQKTGLTL